MSHTAEQINIHTALNKVMDLVHAYDQKNSTRRLLFINDWCRRNYSQSIPLLMNNPDVEDGEKQSLLVHITQAVEKEDWSVFEEDAKPAQPVQQPETPEEKAEPESEQEEEKPAVVAFEPEASHHYEEDDVKEPEGGWAEAESEEDDDVEGALEAADLIGALQSDKEFREKVKALFAEERVKKDKARLDRWAYMLQGISNMLTERAEDGYTIAKVIETTSKDPVMRSIIAALNEEVK